MTFELHHALGGSLLDKFCLKSLINSTILA